MLQRLSGLGASRRLVAAFVLLLLLPAAAVVGLGLRLIVQDRQLEIEQLEKRQKAAAERVVLDLTDRLASLEATLETQGRPGDDAIVARLSERGVVTDPPILLPFHPAVPQDDEAVLATFAPAEALEFRTHDGQAAEASYRTLTRHDSDAVKAGALVRLARVLRKQRREAEALPVYEALMRLSNVSVDGVPAELIALRARCVIFAKQQDEAALRREARTLHEGLVTGKWHIDSGTFTQYESESAVWGGGATPVNGGALARAEAIAWLWSQRGTRGRRALDIAGTAMTLIWKSNGADTVALIAGPAYQQRHWFAGQDVLSLADTFTLRFTPPAEARVSHRSDDGTLWRPASETNLPWDVVVEPLGDVAGGGRGRAVMLLGLGVLVLLVIAGGYVTARAITRELAVARLQSDFVASVSHEFRTPLTSLRQFTDLLNDAVDLPEDKRRGFYAAQSRATDRLHRLVESLLDFRRMEAGVQLYQRRRLDVAELMNEVATEFSREVAPRGFTLEVEPFSSEGFVQADREALSLAIWNLLDNAVKYSGESRHVRVRVSREGGSMALSVQDAGIGIPRDEQGEVFQKFVRGREAKLRSIKGTGLGLAMVKHIVEGHGGRVELESAPGQGSTFRLLLPVAA